MKKIIRLVGGCLALFLMLACKSEDKKKSEMTLLKVGYVQPDIHPWHLALKSLDENLRLASEGRLGLDLYPGGKLGNEKTLLADVKGGHQLDMSILDPAVGANLTRKFELFALPFLFNNYEHWKTVLDGPLGRKYSDMIEEESGIKILSYWGGATRNLIAVKAPVTSIEQLQGFKLRLAKSPLKEKIWSAVGAIPTPIPFPETYLALQNNTVDGMENEYPSILSEKFYEPAKYLTKTAHEITVRPLIINADRFNSLPKDLQDILMDVIQRETSYARELETEAEKSARDKMLTLYGVTEYPIDKNTIRQEVAPVFIEFGEAAGLTDLLQEIQSSSN